MLCVLCVLHSPLQAFSNKHCNDAAHTHPTDRAPCLPTQVFFADSLKFFLSLYGHKLPVLSLDISSDSTLLVSGSADKNIKVCVCVCMCVCAVYECMRVRPWLLMSGSAARKHTQVSVHALCAHVCACACACSCRVCWGLG